MSRKVLSILAAALTLHASACAAAPTTPRKTLPAFASEQKCRASCVDWYGNARPLFLRGRVSALMGYELVEGRLHGGRIVEANRVNFGPATMDIAR